MSHSVETPVSQLDLIVVEDSDLDVEMMVDALYAAGVNAGIRRTGDEAAFRAAMEQKIPDAILADWTVPGFPGARALAVADEFAGCTRLGVRSAARVLAGAASGAGAGF